MKHHRFAKIWPPMRDDSFAAFKADMAANGQRVPILTFQGTLLDGRTRERACKELGIEPICVEADATTEEDALALVISYNAQRRHLLDIDKAQAGSELANIAQNSNRFEKKIVATSHDVATISAEAKKANYPVSLVAAARICGTSSSAITRYRAVFKAGKQAAIDEIISGKTTLFAQYNKLKPTRVPKEKPPKRAKRGRPPKIESKKNESKDTPKDASQPRRSRYATPGDRPRLEDTLPTREQIDPEFKGDAFDWTLKYGQVQVMTALQYATMYFGSWTSNIRELARSAKKMPDWPEVDHNWLRDPKPNDVAKLTEALDYLRPKLAEAEKLLARALETTKQKAVA